MGQLGRRQARGVGALGHFTVALWREMCGSESSFYIFQSSPPIQQTPKAGFGNVPVLDCGTSAHRLSARGPVIVHGWVPTTSAPPAGVTWSDRWTCTGAAPQNKDRSTPSAFSKLCGSLYNYHHQIRPH